MNFDEVEAGSGSEGWVYFFVSQGNKDPTCGRSEHPETGRWGTQTVLYSGPFLSHPHSEPHATGVEGPGPVPHIVCFSKHPYQLVSSLQCNGYVLAARSLE